MARGQGFTLLELVTGLAVAAILLTLTVPAMGGLVADGRRADTLNRLVRAIHLARAEAARGGHDVVLCPQGTGGSCGGPAGDWAAGWLLFVNGDADQPATVDPGESVLLVGGAPPGVSLTANRDEFVFRPFGRRQTNGSFVYCDGRGDAEARALIVSHTGRPRLDDRDASGRALACGGS